MTSPRLTIAFVFDLEAPWLALGYSERPGINSDGNAAIDGTCAGISAAGYNVRRVDGIKTLVKYLASGQYLEWDLVFNIAEGMHGLCREAQVPSLLEAYEIPFTFADAATTALCLDKGRTKVDQQIPNRMAVADGLTVFLMIDGAGALWHPDRAFRSHSQQFKEWVVIARTG